ncbi:MAG: adenosylcobinamide-GDP ribazoletransferase, partial [Sciscionella sp.]
MLLALRLALSLLTVFPVRANDTSPPVAARAIGLAPVVGALLGGVLAAALACLVAVGVPGLLAGLLVVGLLALLTRGIHLDGLADTVDGLGCYGPPERALSVMRESGVGAFAVVALVLVLGMQAVG